MWCSTNAVGAGVCGGLWADMAEEGGSWRRSSLRGAARRGAALQELTQGGKGVQCGYHGMCFGTSIRECSTTVLLCLCLPRTVLTFCHQSLSPAERDNRMGACRAARVLALAMALVACAIPAAGAEGCQTRGVQGTYASCWPWEKSHRQHAPAGCGLGQRPWIKTLDCLPSLQAAAAAAVAAGCSRPAQGRP